MGFTKSIIQSKFCLSLNRNGLEKNYYFLSVRKRSRIARKRDTVVNCAEAIKWRQSRILAGGLNRGIDRGTCSVSERRAHSWHHQNVDLSERSRIRSRVTSSRSANENYATARIKSGWRILAYRNHFPEWSLSPSPIRGVPEDRVPSDWHGESR